jgi:hypothetical protein
MVPVAVLLLPVATGLYPRAPRQIRVTTGKGL